MHEPQVAYRIRTAEAADDAALRSAIGATLAHPDKPGGRAGYRGAASKGDIVILEHYDRQERTWSVAAFVEFHMRVDEVLSIRDIGNGGDAPQVGAIRHLLDELFGSLNPSSAQVKIRRDARDWQEIFETIPGFYREGEEYRRPHYWVILRWDQEHVREAEQSRRPEPARPSAPRPPAPRPPQARPSGGFSRPPVGPRGSGRPGTSPRRDEQPPRNSQPNRPSR